MNTQMIEDLRKEARTLRDLERNNDESATGTDDIVSDGHYRGRRDAYGLAAERIEFLISRHAAIEKDHHIRRAFFHLHDAMNAEAAIEKEGEYLSEDWYDLSKIAEHIFQKYLKTNNTEETNNG